MILTVFLLFFLSTLNKEIITIIIIIIIIIIPLFRWPGENTDLPSDRDISKAVGVNLAFTRTFLKYIQ